MKRISTILFIIAFLLGMFTRVYQFRERFMYAHDNDLASWVVKDIVFDKHPRLIGQQTSALGIFIGPLFYYSLIPFYWITQWDPIGSVAYSWIISAAALISVYYVFRKLYDRPTAVFAVFIYAVSFFISQSERDVFPTTPVMLWSVWFYYSINRLFLGYKKTLYISAILLSLVWHINLALVLLFPLVFIAVLVHRQNYTLKDIIIPAVLVVILSSPLILFESRHGFIQTRSLVSTLTSIGSHSEVSLKDKVNHVVQYAARNASRLFYWESPRFISIYLIPGILLSGIALLTYFRKIPKHSLLLFLGWTVLYIIFFTAHPINLSEYYLNGLNILWVAAAALILANLWEIHPGWHIFSALTLSAIVICNLNMFLSSKINAFGYVEKKALVEFITADARSHNYPCVSVSYITNPGYNLGYRYFYWLNNLHVNQPMSQSPVYTIVFPHSLTDHLDRTFGALGLIYPDYSKYNPAAVAQSCSGANSNLTDPMFGFTK
jgi:hypothetical protein